MLVAAPGTRSPIPVYTVAVDRLVRSRLPFPGATELPGVLPSAWIHYVRNLQTTPRGWEESMTLKEMVPWRWGGLRRWDDEARPFESFFREMDSLHKEMDVSSKTSGKAADVTP